MAEPVFWHKPSTECGKCGKELTILDYAINSNSQLLLECLCVTCGLEGTATITFNRQTIKNLIELDMLAQIKEVADVEPD